jgi:hypothetical protein
VGYQTPWNKVLRGIKPSGTTFKNEYFCEFEKEFKNILGCEFGEYMGGRFVEKTRGKKSRATVPLRPTMLLPCKWGPERPQSHCSPTNGLQDNINTK